MPRDCLWNILLDLILPHAYIVLSCLSLQIQTEFEIEKRLHQSISLPKLMGEPITVHNK